MADRQRIRGIDYRNVPHVESAQSPIGVQIEWIGSQRRPASRGCRVEGISVVKNLREGVHATQSQACAETTIHIHFQRVVRAVASGEPRQGVLEPWIGFGRGWNEIRSGRNWLASQGRREASSRGRGAAGT